MNSQGYFWVAVRASGGPNSASQITNLCFQWMSNQPLTRDCTIITNGSNLLKVYRDGALVFSSATMNPNMPPPFNSFPEVQTTYAGQMLFGVYDDYYATSSDGVTVTNALPSSTVEIEDPSGKCPRVIAGGPARQRCPEHRTVPHATTGLHSHLLAGGDGSVDSFTRLDLGRRRLLRFRSGPGSRERPVGSDKCSKPGFDPKRRPIIAWALEGHTATFFSSRSEGYLIVLSSFLLNTSEPKIHR
ncbi:MAG: hypothetical protein E6K96_01285 [Thaumarchaeota archaeon]|nr:MAG: hypothetical protein E6K96_01285 [Nitrososphaerota archaeon]